VACGRERERERERDRIENVFEFALFSSFEAFFLKRKCQKF
jgi:hypothetical protein